MLSLVIIKLIFKYDCQSWRSRFPTGVEMKKFDPEVMTPEQIRDLANKREMDIFNSNVKGTYREQLAKALNKDPINLELNFREEKDHREKHQEGRFDLRRVRKNRTYTTIAHFNLIAMPGCCGILISSGSYVMPEYQNKGIGTILNKMRTEISHLWGYSLLMCTDVADNQHQQKILEKNGWQTLKEFVNNRTRNTVKVHAIDTFKHSGTELGFVLRFSDFTNKWKEPK